MNFIATSLLSSIIYVRYFFFIPIFDSFGYCDHFYILFFNVIQFKYYKNVSFHFCVSFLNANFSYFRGLDRKSVSLKV